MSIITKNNTEDSKIEVTLHTNELLSNAKVSSSAYFSLQSNWDKVFVNFISQSKNEREIVIFLNIDDVTSSVGFFDVSNSTEIFEVHSIIIVGKQGNYFRVSRSDLVIEDFDVNLGESSGSRLESSTNDSSDFNFFKILSSNNENENDGFGRNLLIENGYVVVAAEYDGGYTDSISGTGEISIFRKNEGGFDNWGLNKMLNSPNESNGDQFGNSIAKHENYIVVGAIFDDGYTEDITNTGEVYVYKKYNDPTNNWGLIKTLNLPSEGSYDLFGRSVTINGDYIVVGANSGLDGQIYIYKKNEGGLENWGLIKTLNSPNGNTNKSFGQIVTINGDYIVVSAPQDQGATDSISNAGEAYVFKKDEGGVDNWGLIKTLNSPNENIGDQFGVSVVVSGDYIVVGATADDGSTDSISNAGEAYVFKKDEGGVDNWGLIKTLNSPDENTFNFFGFSIDIDGEYMIVSEVGSSGSDGTSNAGKAYIFKKDEGGVDNWGLIQTLYASNEVDNAFFGQSVSISGNYIAVGAGKEKAHIFKK